MITWIKRKLAEWKDAGEHQRKINKVLQEFLKELNDIYEKEFRKYYAPKIRKLLEEQRRESKKTD